MNERIKDLETKLLDMASLQGKSEAYRSINETIRRYLGELEILENRIHEIDRKIKNYDIIDFLSERVADMNIMSFEIVVSIMQDIKAAIKQFEEEGAIGYLEKAEELWKKVKKLGFLRLNEAMYKSAESLLFDPGFYGFVKFLDKNTTYRIKVRILQQRKTECMRKMSHIKKNKEFLFRSMIQQELCIFLKLFPDEREELWIRLKRFEGEKHLTSSMLFECFSFSILKEYFRECDEEYLEGLGVRIREKLNNTLRDDVWDEELMTDVLIFIAVRCYLLSCTKPESLRSDEIVEI